MTGLFGLDPNSLPMPNSDAYQQNQQWALPPSVMKNGSYQTSLPDMQELAFKQWVQQNNVPFDPSAKADYDMRGFYQALMNNDPKAATAINQYDHRMHFPDYWKTPQHESFSAESQWAAPNAPRWNPNDQLATADGRMVFDSAHPNGRLANTLMGMK